MKLSSLLGCGVLLATLAGPSLAGGEQAAATVPEILQVQHALRTKLENPVGEYARFDKDAIHRMETAQDRVFQLLGGVTSLDQLNDQQKNDLSNSLQLIKATLLANQGDRVICHMESKTGTHLTERRCETVANRDKNSAEAQKYMLDHPDHIQQPEQGH